MSAALLAATSSSSRALLRLPFLQGLLRSNPKLLLSSSSSSTRRPLTSAAACRPSTKPRMQQPLSAAAAENVNPAAAAGNKMSTDALAPPAKRAAVAAADEPLRVRRLTDAATLPVRGSALAAGYDVASAEDTEVPARGKALVSTGLVVAVPEGTYGRVAPRSGLAWKHHIDVGAGVIDADYRGELKVLLYNHSEVAFKVSKGDRVAQLVLERIATPEVVEDADLGDTARGAGGFGSTGVAGAPPPPA